jgi:hypothetical protein
MVLWVLILSKEKKALFTSGYLGFLLLPPKLYGTSRLNGILGNYIDCSYGHIISI